MPRPAQDGRASLPPDLFDANRFDGFGPSRFHPPGEVPGGHAVRARSGPKLRQGVKADAPRRPGVYGMLDPRGRAVDAPLPVVEVSSAPRVEDPTDVCRGRLAEPLPAVREVYDALVIGTRDYVRKNGFTDVAVQLSGGIDSSLVVAIAADAIGPEHVHCVGLPSRYSSDHSLADAEKLVGELGVDWRVIPIEPAHAALLDMLAPSFEGLDEDVLGLGLGDAELEVSRQGDQALLGQAGEAAALGGSWHAGERG